MRVVHLLTLATSRSLMVSGVMWIPDKRKLEASQLMMFAIYHDSCAPAVVVV